jgi:hypothetical protein
MNNRQKKRSSPITRERTHYHVRLPGFVGDREAGLGDVIKRITSALGVKTCSGCERRAAILNHWVVFSGGHRN